MDFEPTPQLLDGITAANRIARREALLQVVEGHPKSRVIVSGILALGAAIYVGWAWPLPYCLVAWIVLTLLWELHTQTARRFSAVAQLLRDDTVDRRQFQR
jgi:hypothetical protein